MTNKYDSYESELFSYEYPFEWEKRNRDYLKKTYNRKRIREYIEPIVFRLRFYSLNNELISDKTYSPHKHRLQFPVAEEIPGKVFVGWQFSVDDNKFIITQEDYTSLKTAVVGGEDDIKLTAVYEEI